MTEAAARLPFDPIERAISEISIGRPVVVVDDADRENEGDLVMSAAAATPQWLAFMIRHTSGVICAPLVAADVDRLALPPMVRANEDPKCTAFTVSVDVKDGVSTGISAGDRARTIRALADPGATADQFTRPGHVFPLLACPGGVLQRPGHTEAATDLTRLAGLRPAGAIAEIVNDDGTMARLPELVSFARRHDLALVTIEDLVAHRRTVEGRPRRVADTRLPTAHGVFRALGYVSPDSGSEHVALICGDLSDGRDVLVRVHSECRTGDALASLRCDCLALGLPVDARDYRDAALILADLGVRSVRLLTNNPAKRSGLQSHGITVLSQLPLTVTPNADNLSYLVAKRDRMGHCLPELDRAAGLGLGNGFRPASSSA